MSTGSINANATPQVSAAAAHKTRKKETPAQPKESASAAPKEAFEASGPIETVKVAYLPQDPGMLPLATGEVRTAPGLANERFRVSEPTTFPTPKANEGKDYLFRVDDPRFDSSNSFYIANRALQVAEKYAGREIPWSFSKDLNRNQLIIHPHAGANEANAYYMAESGSVNFFHYKDEKSGEIQRTAQQADVVSHETGHAILDALRPNYLSSLSVASGGFHESFGDMMAMLTALNDDKVVDELARQTKGDLTQPNIVSGLAEQLGQSAYEKPALREALNDLKYADQYFLPYADEKDPQNLGTEAHAYSQLFTGAFYDIFLNLYDQASEDSKASFADRVGQARDTAGRLLLRAVQFAPVGDMSYKEMALAFLKADAVDNESNNVELLAQVFVNRKILSPEDLQDFAKHEGEVAELRDNKGLKYTKTLDDKKGAEAFLEKNREALGLPADTQFKFQNAFTNKAGEHFVHFESHRDSVLEGPEFGVQEGSKVRATGGELLVFDKGGQLVAADYDKVTDREIEDIKNNLKTAILKGALTEGADVDAHRGPNHTPRLHIQLINDGTGTVIRRAPVIYEDTCH